MIRLVSACVSSQDSAPTIQTKLMGAPVQTLWVWLTNTCNQAAQRKADHAPSMMWWATSNQSNALRAKNRFPEDREFCLKTAT